jgi:hypothetical protein
MTTADLVRVHTHSSSKKNKAYFPSQAEFLKNKTTTMNAYQNPLPLQDMMSLESSWFQAREKTAFSPC